METITVEQAEDILYDDSRLAIQLESEHRWYDKMLVVYRSSNPEGLKGFYYLRPKSEIQEGQDRFESDPVQVFSVASEEVTITSYSVSE